MAQNTQQTQTIKEKIACVNVSLSNACHIAGHSTLGTRD